MSSNNPLIHPKEDMVKEVIGNLKTDQQKASHKKIERPISKDTYKDMALNKLTSLVKSWSSSRTETEDTKIRSISSASLDNKTIKEQKPEK